jgi:hypothetical protein
LSFRSLIGTIPEQVTTSPTVIQLKKDTEMVKTRRKETKKLGIFVKFSENAKREYKGKDTKMGFMGFLFTGFG